MKRADLLLLSCVSFLTFFGLFMIYDASSFSAFRDFGNQYHYVKDQFIWIILGFIALIFGFFFDYRKYYSLALPLLIVSIVFLILVFIPGIGTSALGAKRWINLGFIILQPSELNNWSYYDSTRHGNSEYSSCRGHSSLFSLRGKSPALLRNYSCLVYRRPYSNKTRAI